MSFSRPEVRCPHCDHYFNPDINWLDAFNLACNIAHRDNPELVRNGYKFWFRGYIPAQLSDKLVGACLAVNVGDPHRMFSATCATNNVQELPKGENFGDLDQIQSTETSTIEQLVIWKKEAMERLIKFVDGQAYAGGA